MKSAEQKAICDRFGAEFAPPHPSERLGIALKSLGTVPLNAHRHIAEGGACGWYIWGGEDFPEDVDYFQSLCVEHLHEYCPELVPYLALAPGWRVLLAPNYEDVWFDEKLLAV